MQSYDNIPNELKQLKRWVNFKIVPTDKKGKWSKIPVNPKNMKNANTTNSETWSTYEKAMQVLTDNPGVIAGVGLVLGEGYVGVDLDDCDDELKYEFINALNTYTELSFSQKGIHLIGKGKLPGKKCRKSNVEMYSTGRFFVMTGNVIGDKTQINDITESIKPLYEKYLDPKKDISTMDTYDSPIKLLDDSQVLERMFKSKNGSFIRDLYDGNWQHKFNSQSDADQSLCNYLAFYCCKDIHQMDRIFRSSKLYREKWERKTGDSTYGLMTLEKAIQDVKNVYSAKSSVKVINQDTGEVVEKERTKEYEFTDTGNAQRFVDKYGKIVKFNYDMQRFMLWNGKKWQYDYTEQVKYFVDAIAKDMKLESINYDGKTLTEALKNCNYVSSSKGKKALLEETKYKLQCRNEEFDRDEYLLNTASGVVDLKTGAIMPNDSSYMCSKMCGLIDPEPPKLWLKFLDDTFSGNQETIDFMQRALGYSLIGNQREEKIFICVGSGNNGKSVLLGTVLEILCDYACTTDIRTFMATATKDENLDNIARMKGIRFTMTSEGKDSAKIDEALSKQISSKTGKTTARFRYGKPFDFKFVAKIWMDTNYLLKVMGQDRGIWRRLIKIDFNNSLTEEQIDKDLPDKLKEEYPQILWWLIQGCVKYFKIGLKIPDEIIRSTEEYKKESDMIGQFINERCEIGAKYSVKSTELYQAYSIWSERAGDKPLTRNQFFRDLEINKNYQKIRISSGYIFDGLQLRLKSEN